MMELESLIEECLNTIITGRADTKGVVGYILFYLVVNMFIAGVAMSMRDKTNMGWFVAYLFWPIYLLLLVLYKISFYIITRLKPGDYEAINRSWRKNDKVHSIFSGREYYLVAWKSDKTMMVSSDSYDPNPKNTRIIKWNSFWVNYSQKERGGIDLIANFISGASVNMEKMAILQEKQQQLEREMLQENEIKEQETLEDFKQAVKEIV